MEESKKSVEPVPPSREERLAAKLRENLKKRKEQARAKQSAGQPD